MREDPRVVAIGGSAGGLQGLIEIISSLKDDRNIFVFTVIHSAGNRLVNVLEKRLPNSPEWKMSFAESEETIEPGHIYIAPSDQHMLLQKKEVLLKKGPRVNLSRPAIDLLFRSAAVTHDVQTIGVILSGSLYDGVAGLQAIQQCGGITIAQKPEDALYPELPTNAIETKHVDYIKPASEIGLLINDLVDSPVNSQREIPEEIILENKLDIRDELKFERLDKIGTKVSMSCPECSGPLWEISGEGPPRYRCHNGHSVNFFSLLKGQDKDIKETLLVALRTMEEKMRIQEKMTKSGAVDGRLKERLSEIKTHTERLRKLILEL